MLSHSAWPHRVSPSITQTLITVPTTQSEESGIVLEQGHIATITGSLTSFSGHGIDHYDTDHTDLTSEIDETEVKREILKDVRIR